MTLPIANSRVSPNDYLRAEAASEVRHEFHDGEFLAMSGGTYEHSVIIANLIRQIGNRLEGSTCRVLEGNMRLRVSPADYVYPDASVVCGSPQFDPTDANRTTILNPRVVIEVLSASTEAYDRGAKFTLYREMPSFEEYVLVSQDRAMVETFVRQADGGWLMLPWSGMNAVVEIRSLKIQLPLSAIYDGLTLPL